MLGEATLIFIKVGTVQKQGWEHFVTCTFRLKFSAGVCSFVSHIVRPRR